MKPYKITFDDIKGHLTDDQQEKYLLPEFKQEIDRRIRNSNRDLGTISPTVLNHRSGVLQKYYGIIQALSFDQFEKFNRLLSLVAVADENHKPNAGMVAREFAELETVGLLVVVRTYHGTAQDYYIPYMPILQEFANSCKSYLYADLL